MTRHPASRASAASFDRRGLATTLVAGNPARRRGVLLTMAPSRRARRFDDVAVTVGDAVGMAMAVAR